jgi:hypothetical protein
VRKALEMIRRLASAQTKAWENKAKNITAGEGEGSEAAAGGEEEEGAAIPSHLAKNALSVYTKFWDTFGRNIKLGLIEDASNRSKLAKLLRYKSSKSLVTAKAGNSSVYRSLDEYLADMAEDQKQIYYIAGESLEAVQKSPFLERLTQKGLEVLFLTEPIDEYVIQNLPEFGGKRLQSIAKEGLQLPADTPTEKRLEEAYKESFKPLTSYLKKVYGDKVEKVAVSSRLATTPCVLVTSQFGYSANMERILKSQAFADPTRANVMHAKKVRRLERKLRAPKARQAPSPSLPPHTHNTPLQTQPAAARLPSDPGDQPPPPPDCRPAGQARQGRRGQQQGGGRRGQRALRRQPAELGLLAGGARGLLCSHVRGGVAFLPPPARGPSPRVSCCARCAHSRPHPRTHTPATPHAALPSLPRACWAPPPWSCCQRWCCRPSPRRPRRPRATQPRPQLARPTRTCELTSLYNTKKLRGN